MTPDAVATTKVCPNGASYRCVDVAKCFGSRFSELPWSFRIIAEAVVRTGVPSEAIQMISAIHDWLESGESQAEVTFQPQRILMHDTTCVPALVDVAAMRDVVADAGGDPKALNPIVPVHAVIDHSLAVDSFASPDSMQKNMASELQRNSERYRLMKWADAALDNFTVFPPGVGILHTINLEHLAQIVSVVNVNDEAWAVPEIMIGTDSHTPMINALGVLGWGVGGLEAEGAMFGVPLSLRLPRVVGVRLQGAPKEAVLATDIALHLTKQLRMLGVVDCFVEFFGPGVSALSVGERAVIANMAPEYGATIGFFAVDDQTLEFLSATGRDASHVALVEAYSRAQGGWRNDADQPRYSEILDVDLSTIETTVSGPHRPQDARRPSELPGLIAGMKNSTKAGDAIAIAAITSCTNTAEPRLLVAAGLLARKARALGLAPPAWVKTSFAPGSGVAAAMLRRAGLMEDLAALGFGIVGYGCTTCIGNSGPLTPAMSKAIADDGVLPIAVLSGNRNFPGRIHPEIDAAFLASPPLVVAYALAGRGALDITRESLGRSGDGREIFLRDIWPSGSEIDEVVTGSIRAQDVREHYHDISGDAGWRAIEAPDSPRFPWSETSQYLRRPTFVTRHGGDAPKGVMKTRPLIVLGDDVTTDHISPAGAIPGTSQAAVYLTANGATAGDLNVYAARRGNFEVMVRGLFTNHAARNLLCHGAPAGQAPGPEGDLLAIPEAAEAYRKQEIPLVIVAGRRYGTGSSRDWAAKGPAILGIRAVLACSFERIHRSNLIGMGIIPLLLPEQCHPDSLELAPSSTIEICFPDLWLQDRQTVPVIFRTEGHDPRKADAVALIDTAHEAALISQGGVIPFMIQRVLASGDTTKGTTAR